MAQRTRPTTSVNEPTPDERAEATAAIEASIADLTDAANAVIVRLSRLTNPIERAKAVAAIREHTTTDLATATDGIYRDAIIEAYLRGRSQDGRYGYGSLGLELGVSRAKVQQVVNGTWGGHEKRLDESQALREYADNLRRILTLAEQGKRATEIAAETGLDLDDVRSAFPSQQ